MDRGGLEVGIQIGRGPCMLSGVIGEGLVKTHVFPAFFRHQGVHEIINLSDTIRRQSFNFLN